MLLQRVWLVRQEGLELNLAGADHRRYMDTKLRSTWTGFKAFHLIVPKSKPNEMERLEPLRVRVRVVVRVVVRVRF